MLSGFAHFHGLGNSISGQDSAGQNSSPRLAGPTYHPLGPRHLATLWRWEGRDVGWCGVTRWWERNTKHLREGVGIWLEHIRLKAPRRKRGCPASRSFLTSASQTLLPLHNFIHFIKLPEKGVKFLELLCCTQKIPQTHPCFTFLGVPFHRYVTMKFGHTAPSFMVIFFQFFIVLP